MDEGQKENRDPPELGGVNAVFSRDVVGSHSAAPRDSPKSQDRGVAITVSQG